MVKVVVVGASGFVGGQVCDALEARGVTVIRCSAPRLGGAREAEAVAAVERFAADPAMVEEWSGAVAVVNAAGNPDASSRDADALAAANGVLAGVLGRLTSQADIARFVHISSAVVQGRRPLLDASDSFDAFSPYARSKVLGERLARRFGPEGTVCYRPPSVHHESRRVTRATARIAASPLSSVAAPGTQSTPQALAANVGDAVAELATCSAQPPRVVIHPWEGLTCASLLELLGDRRPRRLPRWFARTLVRIGVVLGVVLPPFAANARRIEMVWFGQEQAVSWLTERGWMPPVGEGGWRGLRQRLGS